MSRIIVLLDDDEAGRPGRADLARRFAHFAFVKVYALAEEDRQPEHPSREELTTIIGGAA